MNELEFISYDGRFPKLCSGTLVMSLNGDVIVFPKFCLKSGGSAYVDSNNQEVVKSGKWRISQFPDNFDNELKKKAVKIVNEHIEQGCCGGCI